MIAVHGTIQAVINELEPGDPAAAELAELRDAVEELVAASKALRLAQYPGGQSPGSHVERRFQRALLPFVHA